MTIEQPVADVDADVMARVRAYVVEHDLAAPNPLRSIAWLVLTPATWIGAFLVARAADHWAVWLAAWTLQAFFVLTAIAGQHEAIHRNLFRSSWANHVAGQLWGAVFIFPYGIYRAGHLQHHVATHAEGDSEPLTLYKSFVEYLVVTPLSGLLFLGQNWFEGLATLIGRPVHYVRTASQRRIANISTSIALVQVALVITALVLWPRAVLAFWVVPVFVGGLALATMVTLPEHYLCDFGPDSVLRTTRTTRSNAVVRFFFWGTNNHTAHHLIANVPSQNLGELAHLVEPHNAFVESSYLRWHARLFRMIATGTQPNPEVPGQQPVS